jgi:outer membrane protein
MKTLTHLFLFSSLLVFLGIIRPSLADAQDTTQSVKTWAQCVEITAENNAEIRASRSTLESTMSQEGVARGGFLPAVAGDLSWSRGNTTTDGGFSNGTSTYSATLSASQNLFSGFSDLAKLRQARANTRAASATYQITKARISFALKKAFEGFSYSKEATKLTGEITRRRQENLRLVELRFQSGRENKGSVLLSEAYLNQAKLDDLQAQNARRLAQAELAESLGLDDGSGLDIEGTTPIIEPNAKGPELKSLVLITPDYEQSIAQEESAGQSVTVARSQFFPNLSLSGSVGKLGADFFPDERDRWSIGVKLSFPFFNGGRDYYGTQAANATFASAQSIRQNTARAILSKLQDAYSSYIEAVAKLKVDESFRTAATVRAEIARKKYNNGLLSFEDWDVIENDLISRQKVYLQSKRDRVTAEATWEQAQGRGVFP